MQWGLIYECTKVKPYFERLDRKQKILVIASYLYRQFRLVKAFDDYYSESLSELFLKAISAALGDSKKVQNVQAEVEARIPDTDEFSEQEGSYAQNLMIALNYLLLFVIKDDSSNLHRCVDMFLQNVDLLNYDVSENYDEKLITSNEIDVAYSLIDKVLNFSQERLPSMRDVESLANSHNL
jgi:DNA polymerase II large subunit